MLQRLWDTSFPGMPCMCSSAAAFYGCRDSQFLFLFLFVLLSAGGVPVKGSAVYSVPGIYRAFSSWTDCTSFFLELPSE